MTSASLGGCIAHKKASEGIGMGFGASVGPSVKGMRKDCGGVAHAPVWQQKNLTEDTPGGSKNLSTPRLFWGACAKIAGVLRMLLFGSEKADHKHVDWRRHCRNLLHTDAITILLTPLQLYACRDPVARNAENAL